MNISAAKLLGIEVSPDALVGWDGHIEIDPCIDTEKGVVRIDDDRGLPPNRRTFWTNFVHQAQGGVESIADVETEGEARAFGADLLLGARYDRRGIPPLPCTVDR